MSATINTAAAELAAAIAAPTYTVSLWGIDADAQPTLEAIGAIDDATRRIIEAHAVAVVYDPATVYEIRTSIGPHDHDQVYIRLLAKGYGDSLQLVFRDDAHLVDFVRCCGIRLGEREVVETRAERVMRERREAMMAAVNA